MRRIGVRLPAVLRQRPDHAYNTFFAAPASALANCRPVAHAHQGTKTIINPCATDSYLQVKRDADGRAYGVVEYAYPEDCEDAVRKLDGTELRTMRGERGTVYVRMDSDGGRDGGRDRDRSRSPVGRRDSPEAPRRRDSRGGSRSRSPRRSP